MQSLGAVKVTGQRNRPIDASAVVAAKNKVLSNQFASSCGFMGGYSAADDDVTLAYLRSFGSLDEDFSDLSPDGNATAPAASASSPGAGEIPSTPSAACAGSDRRFAAGRNWIARKDKSLTQAFDAYEAGDYAEARGRFEEGWKKLGYEEAALMLGRLHLLGLGTPVNTPKAIEWLNEVIDARYHPVNDRLRYDPKKPDQINTRIEATLLLARTYLTGQGTQRNPEEALRLWRKALDFGFEPANTLIGQAYLSGVGTPVDGLKAVEALTASAAAGHTPAMLLLGQLYHHRAPKQPPGIALDLEKAGAYYGAAARAGNLEATYAFARMLDLGEGTPKAPEKAVVLYKEAAVKGHADAQNALATFFYRGEVVPQNYATARQFFQAAAQRRQPDAMFNLAVMLAQGQGGDKDMAAAYAWCALSKGLGHEQAAAALPAIAAKLSPDEKSRADAMLKPAPKKS
ncbi:TPR repeat protein [Pelomonas aquatica]|uniref:TPR repeat protein n=1 Tax=Pelomonas aquatica TaxID=431058 RepID=A0ABU1Z5X0_9BURK|nr:tetratricopeptide repeat protein [Pelomonas aquatica]MDR7296007.1 TPR repeat protein [Pelomonas aquatica]